MDAEASTVGPLGHSLETPAWKNVVCHAAAGATAVILLFSGISKAVDPFSFARMAEQLLVPAALSMPLALALAVGETLTGLLVLVPRFRRWGGVLASLLFVSFMVYMGVRYAELQGKDCSCFPTLHLPFGITLDFKRAVGPNFFIGDGLMLAGALLAAWWARPSRGLRTAAVMLGAVAVFVGVSYGVSYGQHNSAAAPESITAGGQTVNLRQGKYFVFFFDPECTHCIAASKTMGAYTWKNGVQVIAVATRMAQWDQDFVNDSKMPAKVSRDLEKLKTAFPFEAGPYGVVIENGRQTGAVPHFEENGEPAVTLKKLGVIE